MTYVMGAIKQSHVWSPLSCPAPLSPRAPADHRVAVCPALSRCSASLTSLCPPQVASRCLFLSFLTCVDGQSTRPLRWWVALCTAGRLPLANVAGSPWSRGRFLFSGDPCSVCSPGLGAAPRVWGQRLQVVERTWPEPGEDRLLCTHLLFLVTQVWLGQLGQPGNGHLPLPVPEAGGPRSRCRRAGL